MNPARGDIIAATMRVDIRIVPVDDIIDLRHSALRQGLPREAALFDGDLDANALHFAAFNEGHVLGCATIHPSQWQGEPAWQLRGMAVADSHRGSGIGRALLREVESELSKRTPGRTLWCNARVPASPFYQRLGWKIVSDVFEISTAGPHVRMVRTAPLP